MSLHDEYARLTPFELAFPTQEGVLVFDVPDIIRCEASSNYTIIYLDNQKKVMALPSFLQ